MPHMPQTAMALSNSFSSFARFRLPSEGTVMPSLFFIMSSRKAKKYRYQWDTKSSKGVKGAKKGSKGAIKGSTKAQRGLNKP